MGQPSTKMAPIHNFNILENTKVVFNYMCNYNFSNDELRKESSYGMLKRDTTFQHI